MFRRLVICHSGYDVLMAFFDQRPNMTDKQKAEYSCTWKNWLMFHATFHCPTEH